MASGKLDETVTAAGALSDVGDFLGSFEANAFTQWAQSSLLSELGFPTAVSTQLGKIDNQLNSIDKQLNTIQDQLKKLLGDFVALYNQELQNAISSSETLYTYFNNNVGTYFQGFRSAVNNALPAGTAETDLTIQMVADSSDAVNSFAKYFYGADGVAAQVTMTQLMTNLKDLFSTLSNGNAGLIYELNQQAQTAILDSNYGSSATFNLASTLDGFNESLMNIYSNLVQAMQMTYTIQSTFIYLADKNQSLFRGWVIPIQGVETVIPTKQIRRR